MLSSEFFNKTFDWDRHIFFCTGILNPPVRVGTLLMDMDAPATPIGAFFFKFEVWTFVCGHPRLKCFFLAKRYVFTSLTPAL